MYFQNIFVKRGTADLSSAALSLEFTADKPGFFLGAFMRASVQITETVTVVHISEEGSTSYDTLIKTTSLTTDQNFKYIEVAPIPLVKGDKIKLTCTKANTTGIVFGRIYMGR